MGVRSAGLQNQSNWNPGGTRSAGIRLPAVPQLALHSSTRHILTLRSFPSLLSDPPMLILLAKVLKFNMATKPGLDLNLAEGQGMFTGYVLKTFPPLAMSICF
jgi:hypothetical protein